MKKAHTSCFGCNFADGDTCKVDRLKYFDKEKSENGYYILKGLCNMWTNKYTAEEQRERIRPQFTYFVISRGDPQKLADTLATIPKTSLVIVADTTDKPHFSFIHDRKIQCYNKLNKELDDKIFLQQILHKVPNSLTCIVEAGYNINRDIEKELDIKINDEMSKDVVFQYDNFYVTYSVVAQLKGIQC